MKKISIIKDGKITNQAQFKNDFDLNKWLDNEIKNNSFGFQERIITDYPIGSIDPELKAKATEVIEINIDDRIYYQYRIPSDFSVEIKDITEEIEKQDRINKKIALGELTDNACNTVFKYIQGANVERKLTSEQKTQMTTLFAPALQAIQVKRPAVLKNYIQSITPDGILLTDEIKADILEILKDV